MILCEVDYQRALEQLRRYGEELLSPRDGKEIRRIVRHQSELIRAVCDWVLSRAPNPTLYHDVLPFLERVENCCVGGDKPVLKRNRGNKTNHRTGRRNRSMPRSEAL